MRNPMTPFIESLRVSKHAQERTQQRGFTNHDVELMCRYGTPVADGILMTRDAVRELAFLPSERQRVERLLGAMAIVQESTLVTVFRTSKKWRTTMMHKTRGRTRHRDTGPIFNTSLLGEAA